MKITDEDIENVRLAVAYDIGHSFSHLYDHYVKRRGASIKAWNCNNKR